MKLRISELSAGSSKYGVFCKSLEFFGSYL